MFRRIRNLSLRARLTLGSVAVAALVIAALVMVMRVQVENVVANATRTLLRADVSPYVTEVENSPEPSFRAPGNGQLVAILDPSGKRVLSSIEQPSLLRKLPDIALLKDGSSAAIQANSSYRVVVAHPEGASGRWTVIAASDTQGEMLVIGSLTSGVVVAGLLVLAGFGGATWLLSGAALRPVSRMRREAERLSVGEADAGLPVGDARDELQALARTLNDFLSKTRDAAERERQMVSDASHELRTPLAILTTQLEIASLDNGDAAALQVHVKHAQNNVARLARLANDLLALSRADEAERSEANSRTTTSWGELSDELLAAVDRVRMIAAAKNIAIEFEIDPSDGSHPADDATTEPPVFRLDRRGMSQLVTNTTSNAIDALPQGGTITVTWSLEDRSARLSVTDDGPGVPPEFLAVAFDRFTRPDKARTTRPTDGQPKLGGSGLGLAIVQATAHLAGGTASIRNLDPHGLEVAVVIPRVRLENETARRGSRLGRANARNAG